MKFSTLFPMFCLTLACSLSPISHGAEKPSATVQVSDNTKIDEDDDDDKIDETADKTDEVKEKQAEKAIVAAKPAPEEKIKVAPSIAQEKPTPEVKQVEKIPAPIVVPVAQEKPSPEVVVKEKPAAQVKPAPVAKPMVIETIEEVEAKNDAKPAPQIKSASDAKPVAVAKVEIEEKDEAEPVVDSDTKSDKGHKKHHREHHNEHHKKEVKEFYCDRDGNRNKYGKEAFNKSEVEILTTPSNPLNLFRSIGHFLAGTGCAAYDTVKHPVHTTKKVGHEIKKDLKKAGHKIEEGEEQLEHKMARAGAKTERVAHDIKEEGRSFRKKAKAAYELSRDENEEKRVAEWSPFSNDRVGSGR